MSRFFIDRPIFAIVVALLLVIIGAIAGFSLPIAQYPQISPPTVSVQTRPSPMRFSTRTGRPT